MASRPIRSQPAIGPEERRRRLKAAGYTDAQINDYESGKVHGDLLNRMSQAVTGNAVETSSGNVAGTPTKYNSIGVANPDLVGGTPTKYNSIATADPNVIGGTPQKATSYDAQGNEIIGGTPTRYGSFDTNAGIGQTIGGSPSRAPVQPRTGITAADFRVLLSRGYKLSQLNSLAKSNPAQLQRLVNAANNISNPVANRSETTGPGTSAVTDILTKSPLGQLIGNLSGKGKAVADKLINPAAKALGRATGLSSAGNRADEKMGSGAGSGVISTPGAASGAGIPQFDQYKAPELSYRDFSGQANQQVGDIYSPRYAAIDAAMARARQNYDRSSAVTSGLYENLAKSTAKVAEDTRTRYAQAAADQQQRTTDTSNAVGQTYANNQQQEAGLLQQLGQQESAGILSNDTADSSWQQGQVQREGQAQLANNTAQGNAQQDYVNNIGAAQQTGGVVAQQNLMNQLSGINAGYEQDRFGLQGDQAQAALQLSQQLSDRDFASQQANAQMGLQAYGINNGNAQWQYEQQQNQLDRQQQAALQAQQMRAALSSAQQDQFNADRNFALDQAKFSTGLANDQANLALQQQKLQPQGYQQLNVNDQDPTSRTLSQITSATGGDQATAKNYYDFVQSATNAFAANGLDAAQIIGSQFSFVSEIGRQAQAKGLNPTLAQAAAAAVWQNLLKGK